MNLFLSWVQYLYYQMTNDALFVKILAPVISMIMSHITLFDPWSPIIWQYYSYSWQECQEFEGGQITHQPAKYILVLISISIVVNSFVQTVMSNLHVLLVGCI